MGIGRQDMKQRILHQLRTNRLLVVVLTRRRTGPDLMRFDKDEGGLVPVREYRKPLIWTWRRPVLAASVTLLILLILLSFFMNWGALVSRLGGLLMVAPLIDFFFRASRTPGGGDAPAGADFSDMPFATYARRLEIRFVAAGALLWAFGDWGSALIHCGGLQCSY